MSQQNLISIDELARAHIDYDLTDFGARVLIVSHSQDLCYNSPSKSCKWVAKASSDTAFLRIGDLQTVDGSVQDRDCLRAVVQSCDEVDFTLVRLTEDHKEVQYKFAFEPNGNDLLYNESCDARVRFNNVECGWQVPKAIDGVIRLEPSCYRVDLEGCLIDMKILPRRECFVIQFDDSLTSYPLSQPSPASRMLKQIAEDTSYAYPQQIPRRPDNVSLGFGSSTWLINLKDNETVDVPQSGSQAGYTITRIRKLDENSHSKVIVATQDEEQEPLVVKSAKWDGKPRTLERWLNEFKIHRQLTWFIV